MDPALFGICVVDATGGIVSVGQAEHEFTIMSVSKPFVFALVCNLIGATGFRNCSLAWMLQGFGRLYCDPVEAVDLYTRQCSLDVSAKDLAIMGATLTHGGFNPVRKPRCWRWR